MTIFLKKAFVSQICLIFLFACSSESGPEGTLKKFVSARFSETSKSTIRDFLTTPIVEEFDTMTDNEFKQFNDFSRFAFKRIKIYSKRCPEKDKKMFYNLHCLVFNIR